MMERSETVSTADTSFSEILSVLSPLEKDIYCYLQNGPQTALNIAKAVKKKFARDVNPDLYSMLKRNVLEQNKTFWKIKASAARDTDETTGDKIPKDSGNANYNAKEKAEPGCSGGAEPHEKMIQLTELQKQIYAFLKSNEPSKAKTIAKAVGKTLAKDVNPDLYQMKYLYLLSYNEKLWSINADLNQKLNESSAPSSEDSVVSQSYIEMDGTNKDIRRDSGIEVTSPLPNNTMRDNSNLTETPPGESNLQYDAKEKAEPGCSGGAEPHEKMIQLTELQKQIYAFLKSNEPTKAKTIAKAVGKTLAKDVNPDLYQMKNLYLLSYNEKLWSINADLNQKLNESSAPSSEDSVVSQSYIEMDGTNKDIRRDSGIEVTSPLPNNTMRDNSNLTETPPGESNLQYEVRIPSPSNNMRDESNLTGPPTGESHLQYGSQMCHSLQNITKHYNLNFYQCSNITVGDTTLLTKGDAEPISTVSLSATFLYGPGGNSQPLPSEMPAHQTCPPWEGSDWIANQPIGIAESHSQHENCDTDNSSLKAEQQNDSALGRSRQSGDHLISELSLLSTEGDEGPFIAPSTSSPVPSSHFKQTLNISWIREGLGNVTLDEQDKNCEDHAVISSFAESLS